MQAKPMNIIPMIKGHHLPTLNSSISRFIRLHTNQVRVRVPENKTLTISKENNNEIDFKNYKSLFTSQRLETSKPVNLPLVDGSIPMDFPVGTYYLIGPGLFTDDHGSTVNPLDGHGYLRAFEINGANKEVKFSAQYVKTEAQKDEFDPKKGSWKFTHRGPFSVLKGGKVIGNTKVMKNVANTTVLKWGGRLFCLWEGGAPYEVQPGSLDTIGRFDLIDGDDFVQPGRACVKDVLDVVAALLKPVLHGSAMHLNQEENLYLVIAYISTSQVLCLNEKFMSLNPSKPILDLISTVGLILASCGLSPMISALSLNPSKSTSPLYLFPRGPCLTPSNTHGGLGWTVVEVPKQLWLLHIGNAFEEKDGNGNLHLQIDAVA